MPEIERRRVMKEAPACCELVSGGFIDVAGERWSKTPKGYRPNAEIIKEMNRDFG